MCHLHGFWSACKQRRNPLAVVARDASNPSTGLFAKQQVAGRLGLEPRTTVLETAMLPITPSAYGRAFWNRTRNLPLIRRMR